MRSCGSCTVCCVAPFVEEVGKPQWKPCRYLGSAPRACSIYKERPRPCRTFTCGWLDNEDLHSRHRPDRSGFMIVGRPGNKVQIWETGGEPYEGSRFQRAVGPRLHEFSDVEIVSP